MSERLVIIPTYQERENISQIIEKVISLPMEFDILIVDDNSPDGTPEIVEAQMIENPGRIHLERCNILGDFLNRSVSQCRIVIYFSLPYRMDFLEKPEKAHNAIRIPRFLLVERHQW